LINLASLIQNDKDNMRIAVTILVAALVIGCAQESKNDGESSNNTVPLPNTTQSLTPQVITEPDDNNFTPNPNQANVPADADGKVWHFVCADGCEGGHGDSKAPCPVCGKEMAHNQAFHGNNANAANQAPTFTPPDGNQALTPQTPPTPEPAQNAAGVWHYTCPNGCAGGAASAGPCASCGSTLAHNSAYHQ
jgi:hypothetical protein